MKIGHTTEKRIALKNDAKSYRSSPTRLTRAR
jgi:hypothetical protein